MSPYRITIKNTTAELQRSSHPGVLLYACYLIYPGLGLALLLVRFLGVIAWLATVLSDYHINLTVKCLFVCYYYINNSSPLS
jgi:hypothetical protein